MALCTTAAAGGVIWERATIVSSPKGYLIAKYYEYGDCYGAVQVMAAVAFGACILYNTTVYGMGTSSSVIFTKVNETYIHSQLFYQANCKGQQYHQNFSLGCTLTGNSIDYSISNEYFDLSVESDDIFEPAVNPFAQITVYNSSSCDLDVSKEVVSSVLYSQSCLFDCLNTNQYGTCSFDTCASNVNTT